MSKTQPLVVVLKFFDKLDNEIETRVATFDTEEDVHDWAKAQSLDSPPQDADLYSYYLCTEEFCYPVPGRQAAC